MAGINGREFFREFPENCAVFSQKKKIHIKSVHLTHQPDEPSST